MPLNFPTAPTNGQVYTDGVNSWTYNSTLGVWESIRNVAVDGVGNVGIGTSAPTQKLDVRGQIISTDGTNTAYLNGTEGALEITRVDSTSYIDFKTNLSEDYDCRIQQSTDGLNFFTGGSGAALNNFSIDNQGILTARRGNPLLLPETAKAATGLATVEFATVPTWCRKITMCLNGISTVGTNGLLIQIGRTTYTTTLYASQSWTMVVTTVTGTLSTTGFLITNSFNAAQTVSGIIQLFLVGTNTWVSSGLVNYESLAGAGFQSVGRSPNIGNMIDRIALTAQGNNFDAGTVNVFYE